jgi:hypothetical protein
MWSICALARTGMTLGLTVSAIGSVALNGAADGRSRRVPIKADQRIQLSKKSHVCIASDMDPAFWSSDPAAMDTAKRYGRALSGTLQRALVSIYSASVANPSALQEIFIPQGGRDEGECSAAEDINIFVAYKKLKGNKPFRLSYTVRQGAVKIEGVIDRDLMADRVFLETRNLQGYNSVASIVTDDLKQRAGLFAQMIGPLV